MNLEGFLRELKAYGLSHDIPNISEENAIYLKNILKNRKVKNVLEIGTANGYSTLQFASILQNQQGHIDTIEFSQLAYEEAGDNFQKAAMHPYISQYYGDAREIIPLLETSYDFIFIDGLKKASLDFFLLAWEKLTAPGIIVIDDVMKFRYKMENLYEYLDQKRITYEVIQVDPDDGIMLIEKQ